MVNLSCFRPKYEAWDFRYDMMVDQFERLEVEPAFRLLNSDATDITVDYNDNLTKSGYLIPAARFDRLQEVLVITDLKDAGPEINE